MKRIKYIFLLLLISVIYANPLYALEGYTTGSYVKVRTGPGVNYDYVSTIENTNTSIELISDTLYNEGDENCSLGWYKINYNNEERYICGLYVTIGVIKDDNKDYSTEPYQARIYGININVRSEANSSSTLKTILLPGDNVIIKSEKISGAGCAEGWYKIGYYKDSTGYVCSKYIRTKDELISTDQEYESVLRNLGFPDSYIPYLVKLHTQHPNWVFNPVQTNLIWDNVISGEAWSNYLNGQYINDTTSSIYQLGPSNESNWYYATNAVNAFYLDPRNFLSEKFIFMFENLNYNYGSDNRETLNLESEQTKEYYNVIKNLFNLSYLSADEYIYMFIGAGFTYNVNPVHLASRVYQEGGTKEAYEPITGTSSRFYGSYPLYGYYNYYNIGAYADSVTSSPVLRGLAYACGEACGFGKTYNRPWDTREKAIYGGAYAISDGYINKGQNTIYFQKFNTTPNYYNGLYPYTHQYQTNVTAPTTEGVNTFSSYQDMGLLDLPFTFDIPVYLNMPEVVSLPTAASTINTLKSIKVNDKLISGYDEDVLEYTVYILLEEEKIQITVEKQDEISVVDGDGELILTEEETLHNIVVTSESGDRKTYTIKFIKVLDNTSVEDILEKLSVKVTDSYMNAISTNTLVSTLKQSILKQSPTAGVIIQTKDNVAVSDNTVLKTGQKISITAPNRETKSYTIVVTGDTNGDGNITILDLLRVQKHLLDTTKLVNEELLSADTNSDNSVTILDLLRVQKHILGELEL